MNIYIYTYVPKSNIWTWLMLWRSPSKQQKMRLFGWQKKYAHSQRPFCFYPGSLPHPPPKIPPPKKNKTPELMHWLQRSVCCCGVKIILPPGAAATRGGNTCCQLILGKSPGKSTTLHFNSPICCSTLKWWQDWGLVRVYFCATKTKSKAKWDLSERCLLECMQFFWCMQALCRANLQSYNSP